MSPKNKVFEVVNTIYQIDGYDLHTNNLNTGRGIIIYTKSAMGAVVEEVNTKFEESLFCKLKLYGNDQLLIGNIYRSPNSDSDNNKKLSNLLKEANDKNISHMLLMGDFNFKEIDWTTNSTSVSETHPATLFLESTRDCFSMATCN